MMQSKLIAIRLGWRTVVMLAVMLVLVQGCSSGSTKRLLFVGNSFTSGNNLDQLVASLLAKAGNDWNNPDAQRVAVGGYTFADHLHDAVRVSDAPLRQALVTGSEQERSWDFVLLQEQSQILGFDSTNGEKIESFAAAQQLNHHAQATGATVMLFMTWGYMDGDARNGTIFPDYLTMQERLAQGTSHLAIELSKAGNHVYVIPVGRGFQTVYQDVLAEEGNPVVDGSRFQQLYAEDRKHPSLAGSYLAAAMITAVYTGQSVADLNWQPRQLDKEQARYLREVADRVIFGELFPQYRYPWSTE